MYLIDLDGGPDANKEEVLSMKRIVLAVAAMALAAALCWSQNNVVSPAPSDAKPASTNAPGREYPKVDSQDRTVRRPFSRHLQLWLAVSRRAVPLRWIPLRFLRHD